MSKIMLISLDYLETNHYITKDHIVNMIDNLIKCSNNKIFAYSRDESRVCKIKNDLNYNNLFFGSRDQAKEIIKKYGNSMCIVIGKKDKDFQMAVCKKTLFICPKWLQPIESDADKYGISVDSPDQLYEFVRTINNQRSWYSKLVLPDDTMVFSLSDGRSFNKYALSGKEQAVVENFNAILKSGSRNYYEMFLYHFLSSISNSSSLFNDINYWGIIPSSSGTLHDNEMFNFKERVRWLMFSQPLRSQEYKNYPNLLVRHTPTYKSHSLPAYDRKILGCSNHFETISINPAYRGKLKGKNICIFDDYLTHGNSFECARNLLRRENVGKLIFVTLGRFPKEYQLQNYNIQGNIYSSNYTYNLENRSEIPLSSFNVDENAKHDVENLYNIFNL